MPQKALKQLDEASDVYVSDDDRSNIIEEYKKLNDKIDFELEKISERKNRRIKK